MSDSRLADRRLTRRHVLALATAPAALLAKPDARAAEAEPLRVVATFSILGDWVARVGDGTIDLTTIVPAGGDAHGFDPSPDQVASIADADLIFEIGLGFETWLDDMVEAAGSSAERVAVSDGVALLEAGGEEHEDEEDGHDHGEVDPHIWGDVANAMHAVGTVRDRLAAADPDNAATFEANAATYLEELATLDAAVRERTATIPDDQRKLVTTHDTFGYYARAYGFEIVGTALSSLTTESGDPSASDIAALVEAIEDAGVPAIFAENVSNSDLMEVIADEAGVELAPPLYSDALGDGDSDAPTYVAMMEYNTDTIVTALTADG
jgi:ABC-type Zn uptake system ZnuABC Zn-binding protein ZnuA